MRIAKCIILILLVSFTIDLASPVSVEAQNAASQILVNYAETTDSGDGLKLDIYFTLNDALGKVVPAARVRSATIQLDEGNPLQYTAAVNQPESPFYIALVLDASGSMSRADIAEALRSAAIQAINNAPTNANFSVISFNEEIKVLTSPAFTSDRNRAINAIGDVIPTDGKGTCLYDAAYQAVDQLGREAPNGRRAVVLFTDGVDERASGEGCSTHTRQEVIDLANRLDVRIPIHTIGRRGADKPINEADLRTIAESTGGATAIGDQADLNALFEEIMTGLRSQWSASSVVYPSSGLRTATLLVTLSDGTPLRAVTTFNADRDYSLVPTPTSTPNQAATPAPVSVKVLSIQADINAHVITVNVNVENVQRVSEYRFELKDASTNLLQGDGFVYPAPLEEQIRLSVGNLASGQYSVIVRALGADGTILASSNEERFGYVLPTATPTATATTTRTPTPTQPTNTPLPVGAMLNNIQYLPAEDAFRLYLTLMGEDQIAQLRVEFIDHTTRQLVANPFFPEPAETVDIIAKNMPAGSYDVVIVSLNAASNEIARTTYGFVHEPSTPTPPPTATATATPVIVSAVLGNPSASADSQQLIFPIQTANEDLIKRYVLEFVDNNNSFVVATLPYNAPPYDAIRVNLGEIDLKSGDYTVTLKALDADGRLIAQETAISIRIHIPSPTPTPAPTLAPKEPGFPSPDWAKENISLVLPVIIALIAGLFLVLIILARKPRRQTGTGFLEELTNAQQIKDLPPQYSPGMPSLDPDATNPVPQFDPEATNPIAQILLPDAWLIVDRSRDKDAEGKRHAITHVPYTIGRRQGDLIFPGDDNVSRTHAEITFDQASQRFFITDRRSTHGTVLNGVPARSEVATALVPGAQIRIGMTTVLIFETSASDYDPEKTNG